MAQTRTDTGKLENWKEDRMNYMGDEQYLSRIRRLESEIEYLHGLLDNAGIQYKREAQHSCRFFLKNFSD